MIWVTNMKCNVPSIFLAKITLCDNKRYGNFLKTFHVRITLIAQYILCSRRAKLLSCLQRFLATVHEGMEEGLLFFFKCLCDPT